MSEPDYNDPAVEQRWCEERQADVADYLKQQGVKHGRVGEWPAWHIAPYVSLWAIESAARPDFVGWWAVSGDLPTDYISADNADHPRDALRAIAKRWLDMATRMQSGQAHPTIKLGHAGNQAELAPLLERRGGILLNWANDDQCWGPEYD